MYAVLSQLVNPTSSLNYYWFMIHLLTVFQLGSSAIHLYQPKFTKLLFSITLAQRYALNFAEFQLCVPSKFIASI